MILAGFCIEYLDAKRPQSLLGVQPTFRKFCTLSKFQSKKADILKGIDFFITHFLVQND
ncbi:hypothetical protein BAOM_2327 [Peribacillus asahii]|uniref:Uncharacterized protein n=1 Tax=Peribacillus asahii TaxID=228899 RepID=A0A3T0KRD3_9BACI|nr:hypothetical protein BAOM_2327 [Peribacillus asahii]